MTRTKARELAVRLIYAQGASDEDAGEVLDGFFDEEHFASLAGEDELFASAPDEAQRAYIQRLVSACAEHRDELDNIIARYSEGWRPERISRTAAAVLRCALAEIVYLKDEDVTKTSNNKIYICKPIQHDATLLSQQIKALEEEAVEGELEEVFDKVKDLVPTFHHKD